MSPLSILICIWLHHLTGEILSLQSESITLYCDNQATLKLMQGNNYHTRMKHINICYHFIQDVVKKGYVTGLGAASRAGAHVSCATRQGSVLCLCTSLGSLLFDLTYDTCFISITITS